MSKSELKVRKISKSAMAANQAKFDKQLGLLQNKIDQLRLAGCGQPWDLHSTREEIKELKRRLKMCNEFALRF